MMKKNNFLEEIRKEIPEETRKKVEKWANEEIKKNMAEEKLKEITPCLFKYFRNGIEYWTGSVELAGKRSDTGEYWIVHILND